MQPVATDSEAGCRVCADRWSVTGSGGYGRAAVHGRGGEMIDSSCGMNQLKLVSMAMGFSREVRPCLFACSARFGEREEGWLVLASGSKTPHACRHAC